MGIELYNDGHHVCIMFHDLVDDSTSSAVQANQFLIVSNGEGAIIDPAGNMTYNAIIVGMNKYFSHKRLKYILASHQDPDIVASLNKWLMATDCTLYVSKLWERFVPHFCTLNRSEGRIRGIPDQGIKLNLGGDDIFALPAHFLHAEGNFQFYDSHAKILFSGDMGASLVPHERIVTPIVSKADFLAHVPQMEGFHRRYMVSNKVCRLWARMVREIDVDKIVPQHGRYFQGKEAVGSFLDWIEDLACGIDLMTQENYRLPT